MERYRLDGLFWRQATCAIATAVLIASCGSFVPNAASDTNSEVPQRAQVDARTGSWMMPEAKSQNLLYVSAYSDVLVFTYPGGKEVGDLKGFYSAAGECVDHKGNIFVTNDRPSGAYEYAHGGTKQIAFFKSGTAGGRACAISPTTGDLAICGFSSEVYVYKAAKGKAIMLSDDKMLYGTLDTYDDRGDLFFIGLKYRNKPLLAELLNGSSSFVTIKFDAPIYVEGGLQWNDGLLTATSNTKKVNIYQFQVTGTKAHKVGATPLASPAYLVLQYFIDGGTLVAPNLRINKSSVLYYKYPQGGMPTFTLPGVTGGRAVVISHTAS